LETENFGIKIFILKKNLIFAHITQNQFPFMADYLRSDNHNCMYYKGLFARVAVIKNRKGWFWPYPAGIEYRRCSFVSLCPSESFPDAVSNVFQTHDLRFTRHVEEWRPAKRSP